MGGCREFRAGFAVGLSAGYAGTGADLSRNGRVWVNGGKLGLYATAYAGGFYADIAVPRQDLQCTRALVHLAEFARSMRTLGSYASWKEPVVDQGNA